MSTTKFHTISSFRFEGQDDTRPYRLALYTSTNGTGAGAGARAGAVTAPARPKVKINKTSKIKNQTK